MKPLLLYTQVLFYVAAGINHFRNPNFYLNLMPPYLPAHSFLIALSGIAEIALGLLLLPEFTRGTAAWGIGAMLIAFLPVHIYMIQSHDQVFASIPLWTLYARLVIQGFLFIWAITFATPIKL